MISKDYCTQWLFQSWVIGKWGLCKPPKNPVQSYDNTDVILPTVFFCLWTKVNTFVIVLQSLPIKWLWPWVNVNFFHHNLLFVFCWIVTKSQQCTHSVLCANAAVFHVWLSVTRARSWLKFFSPFHDKFMEELVSVVMLLPQQTCILW